MADGKQRLLAVRFDNLGYAEAVGCTVEVQFRAVSKGEYSVAVRAIGDGSAHDVTCCDLGKNLEGRGLAEVPRHDGCNSSTVRSLKVTAGIKRVLGGQRACALLVAAYRAWSARAGDLTVSVGSDVRCCSVVEQGTVLGAQLGKGASSNGEGIVVGGVLR